MKTITIKISFLFVFTLSFIISGCYTVIWTPEKDFPDESNYTSYGGGYYYYDEYYYYYDYPWWLGIIPPSKNEVKNEREGKIGSIRNSGDGRGSNDSRILTPPPPTRSIDPGDNGSNNSGNQSQERVSPERNSNSSGSNTNTNTSTRQSSNDSGNVRNNDGNRNNNGRK